MKYAILFLLFPAFAFAQNEVTADSTYIKWESGAWYRVTSQTFSNGNISLFQAFIGDTATLYNGAVDGIRNSTSSMAVDVATTSGYTKRVKTLLRESDEILLKAGKSPVDSIETADAAGFLVPGWTMKTPDGTTKQIVFNQTAAKKLRYQYDGQATNKQTDLIGNVIRLRDFPTSGSVMDFYKVPTGKRWTSLDGTYRLIPEGGNAGQR